MHSPFVWKSLKKASNPGITVGVSDQTYVAAGTPCTPLERLRALPRSQRSSHGSRLRAARLRSDTAWLGQSPGARAARLRARGFYSSSSLTRSAAKSWRILRWQARTREDRADVGGDISKEYFSTKVRCSLPRQSQAALTLPWETCLLRSHLLASPPLTGPLRYTTRSQMCSSLPSSSSASSRASRRSLSCRWRSVKLDDAMPDGSLQASGPWRCVGKTLRASDLEPVDQLSLSEHSFIGKGTLPCGVWVRGRAEERGRCCVHGCAGSMGVKKSRRSRGSTRVHFRARPSLLVF